MTIACLWLIAVVLVLIGDVIFVVSGQDEEEILSAAQGRAMKTLLRDLACADCQEAEMIMAANNRNDFLCPPKFATCGNGLVVALDLSSNALAGSLSTAIGELTELTSL
jgi:hypothetical protein